MQPQQQILWKNTQIFGDEKIFNTAAEEDIISAMQFDSTGKHIALGDNSGRLIIFKVDVHPGQKLPEFNYLTELQSHTRQFDTLQSKEIHERINDIKWLRTREDIQLILTTNDNSIKLWKIGYKEIKKASRSFKDLQLPTVKVIDRAFVPSLKREFSQLHSHHINSVGCLPNQY